MVYRIYVSAIKMIGTMLTETKPEVVIAPVNKESKVGGMLDVAGNSYIRLT